MKKLIIISISAVIILAACSKEKINNSPLSNFRFNNEIKLVTFSDGKSTNVTMLEFINIEHYENTLAALEEMVEQNEDLFVSTWRNLDDDALNAKEDEIGFVDYQPLIDFENTYNITSSMRQIFELAEAEWLSKENLEEKNDPSSEYGFDLAEMTLLNKDGEVKIGDVFLKMTNKGFIKIDNSDITTLIRIREGDLKAFLEPNVTTNIDFDDFEENENNLNCHWWKSKNYWLEYDPGIKKVKLHVHFHSYPWKGVSKARITSYKKTGNRWKRYRMNLGAANQSFFKDKNCNSSIAMWSGWKFKRRKSIMKGNSSWSAFPQYRVDNGQSVYGYFQFAGQSSTIPLSW